MRGIAAERVGLLIAKNACCTDSRHSTTQTLLSASAACSHSSTDATASPHDAMISSSAPVHRVGPRAAPQPEHDQRDQREHAGQPDVGGVLGERVELDRDREDRQIARR